MRGIKLSLKKAVRSTGFLSIKNFNELKIKFQALKESILSDKKFAKSSIISYKEFIKSLYSTYVFVPTSLENILREFELELKNWDDSLNANILKYRNLRYKNLVYKFEALPAKINAPLKAIKEKLQLSNIVSKSNRPKPVHRLITQSDKTIVTWFYSVGQGLLNYYRCCNNFYKIKSYVDYFVRWSAIQTLSSKHRMTSKKVIAKWSKDLIITNLNGVKLASLTNNNIIKSMSRKFIYNIDHNAGLRILDTIWVQFLKSKWFAVKCSFKNCSENSFLETYNMRKFNCINETFNNISIVTKKNKRIFGANAFRLAYKYKKIPLCKTHHQLLDSNGIGLKDLN